MVVIGIQQIYDTFSLCSYRYAAEIPCIEHMPPNLWDLLSASFYIWVTFLFERKSEIQTSMTGPSSFARLAFPVLSLYILSLNIAENDLSDSAPVTLIDDNVAHRYRCRCLLSCSLSLRNFLSQ